MAVNQFNEGDWFLKITDVQCSGEKNVVGAKHFSLNFTTNFVQEELLSRVRTVLIRDQSLATVFGVFPQGFEAASTVQQSFRFEDSGFYKVVKPSETLKLTVDAVRSQDQEVSLSDLKFAVRLCLYKVLN